MKSEIHVGVIVRVNSGVSLIRDNRTVTARFHAHIYTDDFAWGISEVTALSHGRDWPVSFDPTVVLIPLSLRAINPSCSIKLLF